MLDPNTAGGAYGWQFPINSGAGQAIMPETQLGSVGDIPGAVIGSLGPHPANNPLFWLLIGALVWSGYVFGGFDFGVKKVTRGSFRVGK